jgi:hypothetical protein
MENNILRSREGKEQKLTRDASPSRGKGKIPDFAVRAQTYQYACQKEKLQLSSFPTLDNPGLYGGMNHGDRASSSRASQEEIERLNRIQEVKRRIASENRKILKNTLPAKLREELATARKLGVKPMNVDDPAFEEIVNEDKIKWAVTQSGELLIIPHTVSGMQIAHSVLAEGRPVLAAGEANIAVADNQCIGIGISNYSGHYLPNSSSLEIGKKSFESYGITFQSETACNSVQS